MFVPKKGLDDIPTDQVTFNKWLAAGLAFIVGIGAGIVGAAGAFILVPIMLVVLKIPTRMTIATSLAITFISSIGTTVGKVITDQILYGPAANHFWRVSKNDSLFYLRSYSVIENKSLRTRVLSAAVSSVFSCTPFS